MTERGARRGVPSFQKEPLFNMPRMRAFRFARRGVAAASDSRLTTEAVHEMASDDIRLLAQQNKSARYIFRNRSLPAMKA